MLVPGNAIRFEPVGGWDAAEPYLPAWRELSSRSGSWLPFQEEQWSRVWWRHWSRSGRLCRDSFVLWVGRDGRGCVRALLPAVLSSRPACGPWRVRLLSPVGPDPNVTELQPLLCRPEDTEAAHVGLCRALAARAREWDGIRWSSVPSGVVARVRQAFDGETLRCVPDYVLSVGSDWERFRAGLPRNTKEAIRKSHNAPQRAGLRLEFRAVCDEAGARRLLPAFLGLHAARASAGVLPRHPDVFASAPARAFLEELVAAWSRVRIARLLALFDDGRLVACRLAFQARETCYLYYSGYDPAYAPYSVMTRALAEGLRWSAEHGATAVNLSTGTDPGKTRWRPACVEYQTLRQWSPTPRGRWARVLYRVFGSERREVEAPAAWAK